MYEFLQLLQAIAHKLALLIQPVLVPICFVLAWTIIGLSLWSLWALTRDGVQRARRMHQIPCAECRYFSGDYHLKCPVHPQEALSEKAIDCPDFEAAGLGWQFKRSWENES
ncbi:MAG: hypothetical protein F6K42_17545 [Leptolyngbya sp. SIO1D8]|nr:hypothetical protein [Leptolyngbya sp. SIO1D8]